MKKGEKDPELRAKLFSECSETEKYMVTMVEVANAGAKLDAMLFRNDFKNRFEESTEAIRILNNACDELRSSEKLRKLMAIILTVVNQINTGGEGKMAMGFTLDALLKLNEVWVDCLCLGCSSIWLPFSLNSVVYRQRHLIGRLVYFTMS